VFLQLTENPRYRRLIASFRAEKPADSKSAGPLDLIGILSRVGSSCTYLTCSLVVTPVAQEPSRVQSRRAFSSDGASRELCADRPRCRRNDRGGHHADFGAVSTAERVWLVDGADDPDPEAHARGGATWQVSWHSLGHACGSASSSLELRPSRLLPRVTLDGSFEFLAGVEVILKGFGALLSQLTIWAAFGAVSRDRLRSTARGNRRGADLPLRRRGAPGQFCSATPPA